MNIIIQYSLGIRTITQQFINSEVLIVNTTFKGVDLPRLEPCPFSDLKHIEVWVGEKFSECLTTKFIDNTCMILAMEGRDFILSMLSLGI